MTAKLIKRGGYSLYVRAHFDSHRPKYTEAVKSLAAFCDKANNPQLVFKVLVTHLDDACGEAMDHLDDYGQRKRP
jgi:hypothetical protein